MGRSRLALSPQGPFLEEFAELALFEASLGFYKWISANMSLLREDEIQGLETLLPDPGLLICRRGSLRASRGPLVHQIPRSGLYLISKSVMS